MRSHHTPKIRWPSDQIHWTHMWIDTYPGEILHEHFFEVGGFLLHCGRFGTLQENYIIGDVHIKQCSQSTQISIILFIRSLTSYCTNSSVYNRSPCSCAERHIVCSLVGWDTRMNIRYQVFGIEIPALFIIVIPPSVDVLAKHTNGVHMPRWYISSARNASLACYRTTKDLIGGPHVVARRVTKSPVDYIIPPIGSGIFALEIGSPLTIVYQWLTPSSVSRFGNMRTCNAYRMWILGIPRTQPDLPRFANVRRNSSTNSAKSTFAKS